MAEGYVLLKDKASPLNQCPKCGAWPFRPFMRGEVLSRWRRLLGLKPWAVICTRCKRIVGYERP